MVKDGDTIGIIALAGACEQDQVKQAQLNIEGLGYKVKLSENIFDKNNYLAGDDNKKLKCLQDFFKDKEIKLILNARGGYGSIRLIKNIDYDLIKNNPKPFCGFSDITALLLMFYKKTGLITYHGPMAISDFAEDFSINNFNNMLRTINNEKQEYIAKKVYKEGNVTGIVWGGNLSTVASLSGQDFVPDEDFIFFAEDLNENVYKIDKMFTQLFNIDKFKKNCKGIVLGDFLNVDNEKWLEDFFSTLPVTTLSGIPVTHNKDKITIPIGKRCYLKDNLLVF